MLQKRRRSLLTLASYGTWDFDLASFPYVYHSLLPNGSEVVKGKVAKIYANGVIENQLINPNAVSTETKNGITFTNNGDGSWTLSGTASADTTKGLMSNMGINGHKYLIYGCNGGSWSTYCLNFDNYPYESSSDTGSGVIRSYTYNFGSQLRIVVKSGTTFSSPVTIYPQLCDLTIQEGTGNEPTTLTDNRIQNLLNRGYIAYNQGEYKGTNVGEIATEPYNLFDGELEVGTLNNGQPVSNNQFLRSVNFIKVLGGISYTIGTNASPFNRFFIEEYDENKTFLGEGTANNNSSFTTKQATRYFKFLIYGGGSTYSEVPTNNTYFARTGTRTGYAKHKPSQTIPFIYQGNGAINAHDTFEITSSEYVFTKSANIVDLSTLNFSYQSASSRWYVATTNLNILGVNNASMPNILSEKYEVKSFANANSSLSGLCIGSGTNPTLFLYTSNSSTLPSGKITYELATPQVIRIPRKHLGIVDLGSLNWNYDSRYANSQFYVEFTPIATDTTNIFCQNYRISSPFGWDTNVDKTFGIVSSNYLLIVDNNYSSSADFKQAMQGKYLYYETAEEVDDIVTRIFTENGGTVTTNVREEYSNLIEDGNFATTGNWYASVLSTLSISDNVATLTAGSISYDNDVALNNGNIEAGIIGHKYLLKCYVKCSKSVSIRSYYSGQWQNYYSGFSVNANEWKLMTVAFDPSSSNQLLIISPIEDTKLSTGDTLEIKEVSLFDFTSVFGIGNEPTSIDDPRIVELSTNGMIIRKPTEVLPNLDLDLPVKV